MGESLIDSTQGNSRATHDPWGSCIRHASNFRVGTYQTRNSPTVGDANREAVREAAATGFGMGVVSEAEFDQNDRLTTLRVRDAQLKITEYGVCLKEHRNLRTVHIFLETVRRITKG